MASYQEIIKPIIFANHIASFESNDKVDVVLSIIKKIFTEDEKGITSKSVTLAYQKRYNMEIGRRLIIFCDFVNNIFVLYLLIFYSYL
jgi:hypothetical protein